MGQVLQIKQKRFSQISSIVWKDHIVKLLKDIDSEEPRVKQLIRMLKNFDILQSNYSRLSLSEKNEFLINTYYEFDNFFSEIIKKDNGNSQTVKNEKSDFGSVSMVLILLPGIVIISSNPSSSGLSP